MRLPIKHHHFDLLGSTQDRARALLDAGEPPPFLVTATMQTAGQGRLGRAWISPPGNFYGSFTIKPDALPARYGEYSFLAAVALRDTIIKFSEWDAALKWPNDVLLDGHKCAGILIESHGVQNEFLIIGIGVNLRHAPPNDAVRTVAAALWPGAAPNTAHDNEFTVRLMENLLTWHARYQQRGFEVIRVEWLAHAHHLGRPICVQASRSTHEGIFTGIDGSGNLLLTQDGHTIKVTTADVTLS